MASRSWQTLANYESNELVRRDYSAKHGLKPSAEHAQEICAPFMQGRFFFESASVADRTVKPLLLYYGVLALARGLTLYLCRSLRDASLAPSHGLSVHDWQSVFGQQKPDIADLTICSGARGSFPELLRATGNRSLLRQNSSAINLKFKHADVPANSKFTLGDLAGRVPAIADTYSRWKQTSHCAPLSVKAVDGGNAQVSIRKKGYLTRAAADRIMTGAALQIEDSTACFYLIPDNLDALPGLSDLIPTDGFGIGDLYVIERYSGGVALSKICAALALSYVLGMLVRYYPSRWVGLLQNQSNDAARPTLFAAVSYLEGTFPDLVVEFLEETGPPEGRMS